MKNGRRRRKSRHGLRHAPVARTEPAQLNRCDHKPRRPVRRSASAGPPKAVAFASAKFTLISRLVLIGSYSQSKALSLSGLLI